MRSMYWRLINWREVDDFYFCRGRGWFEDRGIWWRREGINGENRNFIFNNELVEDLNLIYAIILLCNFSIKEERKNFSRIVSTLVWR